MFEYDRIDISEDVDTMQNKLVSRECGLCGFWFFIEKNLNYQKYCCDGCHDMSMKTVSVKNLAIAYFKGNAYRVHFWYMSKDDAVSLMHNSNFIDKKGVLYFFI